MFTWIKAFDVTSINDKCDDSPFHTGGTERLGDLPKVTQLVSGRARIEAQMGTVLSSLKSRTISQRHVHCPPCHSDTSSSSSSFGRSVSSKLTLAKHSHVRLASCLLLFAC